MAQEVGLVDILGGLDDAIAYAAAEAELTEFKIREYPKVQDPINLIMDKMQGNISAQHRLVELSKNTGFEQYVKQLNDLERWGTSHTVQAIMPYNITVQNYSLR